MDHPQRLTQSLLSSVNRRTDSGFTSLVAAGAVLVAAGGAHLIAWSVYGGPVGGPVSYRKPILFCFASGVTCWSLAWVYFSHGRRKPDAPVAWLLSTAIVFEVFLIAMQQWRGVPSHFNRSTGFDASVLVGIKVLVAVVSLAILYFCIRSFSPLRLTSDLAVAARAGLVLLVFACLVGFVIEAVGEQLAGKGLTPSVYRKAGVLKFPHGMPLHAIQYLPGTAWVLALLGVEESRRRFAVWFSLAGIVTLTLFALLQTYAGRERFEVSLSSGALLACSGAMFLVPISFAANALAKYNRG